MQRKLNDEFIREYSEEFSENITSNFFEKNDKISGKEILSVSPSKQVNFFVLKILFRKWQEEMKQLESPFFNYRAPEVRKAMVQFMNTLSQHIEVGPDHFQLMLEEAVANSLLLATDPASYLTLEFEELDVPQVNEKITKPILKYLRLHKDTIAAFFERNNRLAIDDFLDAIPEYFEDVQVQSAIDEELANLSKVITISEEDIFITEDFVKPIDDDEDFPGFADDLIEEDFSPEDSADELDEEQEQEEASIEDTEDHVEEAPYVRPEPSKATKGLAIARTVEPDPEPELPEEESEPESEELEEEAPDSNVDEEPEEAYIDEVAEAPTEESADDEADADEEEQAIEEAEAQEEQEEDSVNEQFKENQATVNDRFAEENSTLADKMEKRKVNSIMEAISVNHRYMFTKELFDGDRDAFTQTIDDLEACTSFDDAVEMLVQSHAKPREWDMNSDEVKELLKVVFRKFR